jgi:hypothetical protein
MPRILAFFAFKSVSSLRLEAPANFQPKSVVWGSLVICVEGVSVPMPMIAPTMLLSALTLTRCTTWSR